MLSAATQEIDVRHLQRNAMNLVELLCDGVSEPVQKLIRPFYGSRYFPVPVTFIGAALMILLPAFAATATGVLNMIPFVHVPMPAGMFGLASFAQAYFLVSFVHGVRTWRRMIHPEKEAHSQYEGPGYFFFNFLPQHPTFDLTRIVYEPLFVVIVSIVLQDIYIIQSPLATYLKFAALCMMLKNFCVWYRDWEYMRGILDMSNAAPIVSKIVSGTATPKEAEQLHVVSIPSTIDPEIRRAAQEAQLRRYIHANTKEV